MTRKIQALGVAFVVVLLAESFQAAGTTITTTSYSTWSSSSYTTGSQTLVDLTTLQAGMNYSNAAGYTSNGYNFTGPDGPSYVLTSAYEPNVNSNGLLGASDGVGAVKVTMPGSGNSAVFFDAQCITCSGAAALSLTLSDGETFSLADGQFGLSISHNITWFELNTLSGNRPFLEYVYFGTSSLPPDPPPAKEAATIVLMGGGLVVVAGLGRRTWLRRLMRDRTRRAQPENVVQGFA